MEKAKQDRQIKLYGKAGKKCGKLLRKYGRKYVGFVVEPGTWVSYFQKLFTKDKTEEPSDRKRNSAAPEHGRITQTFNNGINQKEYRPKKNEE